MHQAQNILSNGRYKSCPRHKWKTDKNDDFSLTIMKNIALITNAKGKIYFT